MTARGLEVDELATRTEDEVREHLAQGKLVEGLQHMSPEYLKGMRRILTVSADTVRIRRIPFRYSGDMCCRPSTSLPAARCSRTSSSLRGASSSTDRSVGVMAASPDV